MQKSYLTPSEITDYTIEVAVAKTQRSFMEVLFMAVMAGMYITMGALAASTASHAVGNSGLAKLVAGVVFPIGLMFVILNGADLFTGNCLIITGVMDGKVTLTAFGKNLATVLLGNFLGPLALTWMQARGGMFMMSSGQFGAYTVAAAAAKVNMGFFQALILAIICNLFVCAGVWLTYAAQDAAGKLLAAFFAIVAFVISGSEHIVANMYYISAGILAKKTDLYVELAAVDPAALSNLTWKGFLIKNAVPVTLGNIIGGVVIGVVYYMIYKVFPQNRSIVS